jgi:predicted CXXCH cytochrome family protein
MVSTTEVPTGSSKLCLSCHDGTIALGKTLSRGQFSMQAVDVQGRMNGRSVLGTNLSDDHPISIVLVPGTQVTNPPVGSPVKLDEHGRVQCRSCHDPHQMDIDPTALKFLVMSNSSSGLCTECHQKTYWSSNPSSHRTSTKAYTSAQGAHTAYGTVATNGCEACHQPHTAAASARTLKAVEEATCGTASGSQCHGSSVIGLNVTSEFDKAYRHPTYSVTPSVHDASESPGNPTYALPETSPVASRHAECPDCHNPHASYAAAAVESKGSGAMAGVWGIDGNGTMIQPSGVPPSVKEYEVCYKCHSSSANKPQTSGSPYPPYPIRQIAQLDVGLEFDPANPSFHPVENRGKNDSVPSLIRGWTVNSIMLCSDCHNNDQGPKAAPLAGTGPSGPHGSNVKHLLLGRYDQDLEFQSESAQAYALCYKCHSRTSILGNNSFKEHDKHIVDLQSPCSVCHDPHGVSATQGTVVNNSHLINFDLRWVTPSSNGLLRFEDLGLGRGRCYLTCHGEDHKPEIY